MCIRDSFSSEEKVELINGTSEESFPILVKKAMTKFILQNGWAEKTGFSKKRQTENLKKWVERWAHHIRDDRQYVPPSMEKSLQQVVAIFDENALKPSTPSEFDSCKSRISHLLSEGLSLDYFRLAWRDLRSKEFDYCGTLEKALRRISELYRAESQKKTLKLA